jgi:hypothetical protein
MQKAIYVTEIFHVLELSLSKLSTMVLLYSLTKATSHSPVALVVGGFVIAWTFPSIFVVFFQCRTPDVWNFVDGNCVNMVGIP